MLRSKPWAVWLAVMPLIILAAPLNGQEPERGVENKAEPDTEQETPSLADQVRAVWADEYLSDNDKLQAFRMITENEWLAFAGFVHVYSGRSYLDVFHWHKTRFGEAMAELDSDADVDALLAIAKDKMGDDPLVSADAMMLAAMLNWEAAQPVLIELSNPNVAKDALVRPIHIHTLCLIAASKQSLPMIEHLQPILHLTAHEEIREDILCAIVGFNHAEETDWVKGFVEANVKGDFDQALRTALLILSKRLNTEKYKAYMDSLIESVQEAEKVEHLARYRDDTSGLGVMEPPPNGVSWFYKGWDGFEFTQHEDGVGVRFGDRFEYFVRE